MDRGRACLHPKGDMDSLRSTGMVAVSAVSYDRPFRVLVVDDNDINRALLVTVGVPCGRPMIFSLESHPSARLRLLQRSIRHSVPQNTLNADWHSRLAGGTWRAEYFQILPKLALVRSILL
jgi:hypothetical protein